MDKGILTVPGDGNTPKKTETVLAFKNRGSSILGYVVMCKASAILGQIKDESRVSCNGSNL
jgi:hypothetical protein